MFAAATPGAAIAPANAHAPNRASTPPRSGTRLSPIGTTPRALTCPAEGIVTVDRRCAGRRTSRRAPLRIAATLRVEWLDVNVQREQHCSPARPEAAAEFEPCSPQLE